VAIGATGAYFSDNEVLVGNSFSSGTLDLVIPEESRASINLENMKPGDSTEKVIDLINNGSLDFGSLKMSMQNVVDEGSLLSGIDMTVTYTANVGTENETSVDLGTFKASDLGSKELVDGEGSRLLAGNSGKVNITFALSADAGNEYQGLSADFDLAIDAEQVR
jgi:predicted ribosomally synthesized peptide with SipW-like signal peptide